MNPTRKFLSALLALITSASLQAASYYVDPATGNMVNPGSAGAPWSTLEAVFAAGKTFAAGDVIYLRSGFHGSPVVAGHNAGDVTIQADFGQVPRLRKLTFDNASRWIAAGLDISPRNASVYDSANIVVIESNSSFITVTGCLIYNTENVTGWSLSDMSDRLGRAIRVYGPDCVIANNHLSQVRYGIGVEPSAPRTTVRHNLIEDIMNDGIRFHADDTVLEYNVIRNFYGVDENHDDGIQGWTTGPGGAGYGTITGGTIRGNYILNADGPGRPFPDTTFGVQGIGLFNGVFEGIVIENNTVILEMWHGITIFGAVDCIIANNTVVQNPYIQLPSINKRPWITIRHNQITDDRLSSGNLIINNRSWIAPFTDLAPQGSTLSNNLISSNHADHFVNYAGYDLHLISTSPAIDAGTSSGAPALDADGVTRTSSPDIGAYEYTAWPPLVAHWKLDEINGTVAPDASVKGNPGRLVNGPAWTPAQVAGGLNFDGGDDIVTAGSGPNVDNLPAVSVSAWIKADSLGGGSKGRIVAKAEGTGPIAGWHLHLTDTNQLQFRADYATTDLERISSTNVFSFGTWKHIVATWAGGGAATDIKFYVNGVETGYASGTAAAGSRVADGNSGLYVGNNSTLARGLDGTLDDVRVYAGALSGAQVTSLFQAGPPLPPTSLVATKLGYNQVNLSWTDQAGNETGFRIERKKGAGGTYVQIGTAGAVGGTGGSQTYSDTTAGAGTLYYYRVRAYSANGDSDAGNEANATTDEITSGRVGHWKLDENAGTTAADASGSGNTGTLGTSPTNPAWATGRIGTALDFDGTDDVVNAGSGSSLDNLSAVTVTAWIRADSLGGGSKGRVVTKASGIGPTAGWHLHVTGTNQLQFRADYATTDLDRVSANNTISLGAWRHVVATWTGSATATNVKIYVDGVETAYASTTNGAGARANDATSNLYLGNESGGTRTFDGLLDDVRVYNRVLSAAEIEAVYRAGL
ncbi:MAG TPA: LamG-like jellyroll fold domain-containing protein [Opitutaceae bacterium]